jgi:hypothetical protein
MKKIYIKSWLDLKPYKAQVLTDNFYLNLSNEIKMKIFEKNYLFELYRYLDEEKINELCCYLSAYVEDLVSETNIWNTFIRLHKKQYKKYLPFYDTEDYFENEVNEADISFLLWHFINAGDKERLVSPYNTLFVKAGEDLFDLLADAWESAPSNKTLKAAYKLKNNCEDYYDARMLMDKIFFNTYLFYLDTGMHLNEEISEIFNDNRVKPDHKIMIANETRDQILNSNVTALLALKSKEWAAEILGEKHDSYNDLLSISQRVSDYFLYKNQDETYLYLEHVASGKKINLLKKSFEHYRQLTIENTIIHIGLVKWRGEWWFSGIEYSMPYNQKLVDDERNNVKKRNALNFLDFDEKAALESILLLEKAFLKYNNNSPIAFLPASEINGYLKNFYQFYNESIAENPKKAKNVNKKLDKAFVSEASKIEGEHAVLFFNPQKGLEILIDCNSAFPLKENPFYDIEESDADVSTVLFSHYASPELAEFCIKKGKSKLKFFKHAPGKLYLDDIDFLMKYNKKENYYSKPEITQIKS